MKTSNIFLTVMALLFLVFTSCTKDDNKPEVKAGFTASATTASVGESIQFTNNSANATAFTWSFGDGTTSTDKNPSKIYNTSDVFEVTLSAKGEAGTTTSKASIKILPKLDFVIENVDDLQVGTPVKFTNKSIGATSYEWNFGDDAGTKSTDPNPTFTFNKAGEYTVSLTATGKGGPITGQKKITVKGAVVASDLYYIEFGANKIKKLNLASGAASEDILDISGKAGVGLAFDSKNNKIYFSDFENEDEGKIWSINLDGSGLKEIASGITDPYNIALNIADGKIYWADDNGNISRANLDGSSLETSFINIADGQMRGVSYDPVNKKLYFYEVNDENLYIANADGTGVKKLIEGVYGYGIFVDAVNGNLYFDERNSTELKRANLDGTNITTIAKTAKTRIHGIDIDYKTNKIYWADRDAKQINRANFDGSGAETVLSGLDSPRGLFIK